MATEAALLEIVIVADWSRVAGVALTKLAIRLAEFSQHTMRLQVIGIVVVCILAQEVFVIHPAVIVKAY